MIQQFSWHSACCVAVTSLFASASYGQAKPDMPNLALSVALYDSSGPSATALLSAAEKGVYRSVSGDTVFIVYSIFNEGDKPASFAASDLEAMPQNYAIINSAGEHVKSSLPKVHDRGCVGDVITILPGDSYSSRSDILGFFPPEGIAGRNGASVIQPDLYKVTLTITCEDKGQPSLWVGKLVSPQLLWRVEGIPDSRQAQLWAEYEKSTGTERTRRALLLLASATPSWNDRVAKLLKDVDPTVRMSAAFFAARIKGAPEIAVKALVAVLTEDKGDTVSASAAYALGELGGEDAVEPLIQAVKSRRAQSYREAVRALGKIGDKRAVPTLEEVAKTDTEEWVRKAAEESLRQIASARMP